MILHDKDFIFIWTKEGQYKVFNLRAALCATPGTEMNEEYLTDNGWKHVATIDPSLWIKSLLDCDEQEALVKIQELR